MKPNPYAKRTSLTTDQQQIILQNYQNMSAGQILILLKEHDPETSINAQTIYGFLRRVKREAQKSINTLIEHNAPEAAEKLKEKINTFIPEKRSKTADAISIFLDNLISTEKT